MRLPIIPFLVAAVILTGLVYLFFSTSSSRRILDAPRLARLADIEGTETEVAIAPDGNRLAVIADGDLWLLASPDAPGRKLTDASSPVSFPAWAPDEEKIAFAQGGDTLVVDLLTERLEPLKADASSFSWSPAGTTAFVRDRALWIADPDGANEHQLVEADANPDITIRTPRFSPDSMQIAFIKSQLNLRGEVWIADVPAGDARPVVADREAENPLDVGWIAEGNQLVYLTDRSGPYSLWYVDFAQSTILPLTPPLVAVPLEPIGISVWKDRIVLPRHFVDSDLSLSDGTTVVETEDMALEPAVSPDGTLVAYTVEKDGKFEIWTATISGEGAKFRTLGREPRFSPNGFELVYTHTDLHGNADIWTIDLRDETTERMTDADEMDVAADWSPDGLSIAFSSARGGPVSISVAAAVGGKRLRINNAGYAPRYSRDGQSIFFWHDQAFWSMDAVGGNLRRVRGGIAEPAPPVWTEGGPAHFLDSTIQPIWPWFDILPDGRWLVASIQIRETALWAVDLVYREN